MLQKSEKITSWHNNHNLESKEYQGNMSHQDATNNYQGEKEELKDQKILSCPKKGRQTTINQFPCVIYMQG